MNRIEGVQWAGFKQGACYSGHLPEGLGSFAYQVEGQRLLVVADLVELLEVAKPDVFQSLTEGGMHLTAEQSFSMLQELLHVGVNRWEKFSMVWVMSCNGMLC